jgi:hypothetical protein
MAGAGTSRGEEISLAAKNARARMTGAVPVEAGVATDAGGCSRTMQQFCRAELPGWEAWEQQLCAVRCAGCRQTPNGASRAPIKRMATAARWKNPLRMRAVYHGRGFVE